MCSATNQAIHGMLLFMLSMTLAPLASYEPNWFLSTVVQSTAALVAIMGGFLISRLISMVSERSTHIHRLAELEDRKQITSKAIEEAERGIQDQTNDWFFDKNLDEVVKSLGQIDVLELVSEFHASGHQVSQTLAYADQMANIARRAFKELSAFYGVNSAPPETVEGLRNAGFQIDGYEEEVIFEKMAEKLASTRNLVGALASLRYPDMNLKIQALIPNLDLQRHEVRIAKQSELKANLSFIEAEISLIRSKLPSLSDPRRLIWGFGTLTYFGAAGIVYPLYLMTKNPVIATANTRSTVLLAFLSGFLALLLYIAIAVKELGSRVVLHQESLEDTEPPPI